MKQKVAQVLLAGCAGGLALNVSMLLTFRLLGFGWQGGGILLDPSLQSEKLISVWTEIEPIPLVVDRPAPIIGGLMLFAIGHALIYHWLGSGWPAGLWRRAGRLAALLFLVCFLFWEFFTPFNMFGEPLPLLALELLFWALIAFAESVAIVATSEAFARAAERSASRRAPS